MVLVRMTVHRLHVIMRVNLAHSYRTAKQASALSSCSALSQPVLLWPLELLHTHLLTLVCSMRVHIWLTVPLQLVT